LISNFYQLDKYSKHISVDRNESLISVDKYPTSINLININTYQVNINERHISVDKYPTSINTDKHPEHIKLIEFGDISS